MTDRSNKMRSSARALWLLVALLAALPAGCDDGGPVTPGVDSGPEGDGGPPPGDAGDVSAPTVIATAPIEGASSVPLDQLVQVAFSEAMDTSVGELSLSTSGGALALDALEWDAEGTTVSVRPTAGLPAGSTITLRIEPTFADLAGNTLAAAVMLTFSTDDTEAPTIVRTAPVDDATGVSPATIEIEFSEPMRSALGTLRIEGPGAPTVGTVSWMDRVASAAVEGLSPASSYRVFLEGFEDVAGNALDTSALGDDGALDFTTGADETAPAVVDSTPREATLDVSTALVTQVALTFSEPMDTSRGAIALEVGGTTTPLTGSWDRGGTRLRAPVSGLLEDEAAHRVTLTDFADVAGNTLDGAAYLIDGALDFTTGMDSFAPFVAFSVPTDGDLAVPGGTDEVVVIFSEAMDTSRTTASLTGDGRTVTLDGVWSAGDTILTLDARVLQAGRSYALDLAGFMDAGGTALDVSHPYLGDGVAEFALSAPTGERCGDALTDAEATPLTGGAVGLEWVIPADSVTAADGSAPCDVNAHGPDAVVRYRKATAASGAGGTALHIVVTPATSSRELDVDILANDCRPDAPSAATARLRCLPDRSQRWETWLDVGPGDYFVWVAHESGVDFDGATVTIEEVPMVREGESCASPLDVMTTDALYTAPGADGEPYRWVLPGGYALSPDRGAMPEGPDGALSCDPDGTRGDDQVVVFDKSTDTSLVTIRVSMPATSSREAGIEIARGCDPAGAGYTPLECLRFDDDALTREITLDGPAGPISTWMVSRREFALPGGAWEDIPPATIEITEFEPMAGDSCATAIPITPGITNPVTATRPWRADAPGCFTGGVTWFRYTTTEGLGIVRTDGLTLAGAMDATTGQALRCGDDTMNGLPVFAPAGTEVCVAIQSSPTVHQITIEEGPYSSVRGIETDVNIDRPAGAPVTPTLGTSGWMAVHAGRIWRGAFEQVFHAPVGGGDYTWFTTDGMLGASNSCRYAGLARPDGIYCIAETSATTGSRVYRIVDAAGVPLATPEAIDLLPAGETYPAQRFDGFTWDGTQFLLGTAQRTTTSTDSASFYALPAGGGAPVLLGTNDSIQGVGALAADADYLYIAGRSGSTEGVFRLTRSMLSDPAQPPVVLTDAYDLVSSGASIAIDDTTAASAVFFRSIGQGGNRADILLIVDPRAATPRWVGPLWRAPGTRQDNGLGFDPSGPSIWLLHTNGDTAGIWLRLD